jgi:transcriptional regulator with XRE-family HTH domain
LTVRPGTDILDVVADDRHRSALRAARAARGWSQTNAARALAALARSRGVPVAAEGSLKTQLSRWENGHATPDAPYPALLGELYERSGAELGFDRACPPDSVDPAERLRARLAAAAAVDREVVSLWSDQLTAAQGLDDRLGAPGSAEAVRVLSEQLEAVLPHLPDPPRRRPVAALLARAALLAGTHALDAGDPDTAVTRYARAGEAAREAGSPELAAESALGHAATLLEVGEPSAALAVVEHTDPHTADPVASARCAAVSAAACAAAGDTAGARHGLDAAARARADVRHPPSAFAVEWADTDLHHWHGRTLCVLGDPTAVEYLSAALAESPRSVRGRAALHAELARALAARGRPEEAAEHARSARALAAGIGSRRIPRRLDDHEPRAGPAAASSASAAR